MIYRGLLFEPYFEPGDPFIEQFETFRSRLHVSPDTGHMRYEPMTDRAILDRFYNGDFARSTDVPTPESEFTPQALSIAEGVLRHLEDVAHLGKDLTIHDVGCGFGAMVWAWQQLGVTATGNEANREWVRQAGPHCNDALSAAPLQDALDALDYQVDAFFVAHVLEHLADPVATLEVLRRKLSERGVVYICVPNAWSYRAALYGRRSGIDYENFPMHLNFFSPRSLQVLLNDAGLDLVQIETRSFDEPTGEGNQVLEASAQGSDLLGGELFALAALPLNAEVERRQDPVALIDQAQRVFSDVQVARGGGSGSGA